MNWKKLGLGALAAAAVSVAAAAEKGNMLSLSLGDMYATGRGAEKMDSPEAVELGISTWAKQYNIKIVNWRFNDEHMENFSMSTKGYVGWQMREYDAMRKRFDDNKAGLAVCRKLGLKFILNFTFNDGGWPERPDGNPRVYYCYQDKALIANPELQEVDKRGVYHYGYLDLSNPAARKLMVDRIVMWCKRLQADGIYLNTRSHSGVYSQDRNYKPGPHHADRFGFGKNLVAEYKKRYGIDIMTDERFDYTSKNFAPQSAEVENWRKLRGEYFEIFYKEVREALGKDKMLVLSLPLGNYMGSSGGNIFVDHEKILKSGIADGIVLGVSSGYVPINLQRKLGYLSSEAHEANYNVPTFAEYLKKYGKLASDNKVKLYSNQKTVFRKADQKVIEQTPHHEGIAIHLLTLQPHPILSDSADLRPAQGVFSAEAVVKPYKTDRLGEILSKYDHRVPRDMGRGWALTCQYEKYKKGNPMRALFRVNLYGRFNNRMQHKDIAVWSKSALKFDEYVHIGGTVDMEKDEIRLYVNGKLENTVSIPENAVLTQNNTTDFTIGCYSGSRTATFSGLIDSVRISHAPIVERGSIPSYTGKEAGTKVFYRFDGTVEPQVKPADSEFEFIGIKAFGSGVKGGKALEYAKAAL